MSKFSIIIPIYNVEKYLEKCLDSVINQTYHDYEVILVCDDSDDNSNEIVNKYVKKNKFKVISAQNTGLSKARNLGVEKAKGEYLVFLDGDDYLENDFLEVIASNLQDNPEIIRIQVQDIYPDKKVKYEEEEFNTICGIEAFNKIIKYHYIENAWCYIYNSKFYKKNKFKFMDNCIAEDYGLIPLIIAKAKKIKSLNYIGYNYVQRENSLMTNDNYNNKIKKMNDMLKQAEFLKKEMKNIDNNDVFIKFINNSLIYYSTRLKYKDFKKYNKLLKENNCYKHLKGKGLKNNIRNFLIKHNTYFFYNYIVR